MRSADRSAFRGMPGIVQQALYKVRAKAIIARNAGIAQQVEQLTCNQ